ALDADAALLHRDVADRAGAAEDRLDLLPVRAVLHGVGCLRKKGPARTDAAAARADGHCHLGRRDRHRRRARARPPWAFAMAARTQAVLRGLVLRDNRARDLVRAATPPAARTWLTAPGTRKPGARGSRPALAAAARRVGRRPRGRDRDRAP